MPIPAKETLQVEPVPATEAKTYDSLWAHRIIIGMPSPTSGGVRIDFSHYDAETGDVTPSDSAASENISIEDLPTAISEVPEVEAAMAAGAGARTFVTDSNNSLVSHHGQIVTGGGSDFSPVYSDGTNWIAG